MKWKQKPCKISDERLLSQKANTVSCIRKKPFLNLIILKEIIYFMWKKSKKVMELLNLVWFNKFWSFHQQITCFLSPLTEFLLLSFSILFSQKWRIIQIKLLVFESRKQTKLIWSMFTALWTSKHNQWFLFVSSSLIENLCAVKFHYTIGNILWLFLLAPNIHIETTFKTIYAMKKLYKLA